MAALLFRTVKMGGQPFRTLNAALGGSNTVRGWALNHIGPYAYNPETGIEGEGSWENTAVQRDNPLAG